MAAKPRVTIVGAGNLATALATALHRSGYSIDAVIARGSRDSLRKATLLAGKIGATAVTAANLVQIKSKIVWFCVPDGQISPAARLLAGRGIWEGRVALHSSGALTRDELSVLRQRGATVASVHPLMTFVRGSRPSLAGVPFTIEGDLPAVRLARRMVKDLRGQSFSIKKRDKVAYHAWGTFASPLLTALLATTERVAAAAGVSRIAAQKRMLPILAQTIANYAALGAAGGLSGPILRGDAETVQKHLRVLQRTPLAREVYVALAKASLQYLPGKQRMKLKKLLTPI
jgi:predicted short-subunit dehydrogenase-like oxidoreductase (DUF2520 family)